MIHELSKRINTLLSRKRIIKDELSEVYVYGTELFLSFILTSAVILTLGAISNMIIETLLYMIQFIGIRRLVGGFHAKTYLRCFICTVSFFSLTMVLSKFCRLPLAVHIVIAIAGSTIILLWGPIENEHKKISVEKKQKFKLFGTIVYGLSGLISCMLSVSQIHLCDIITYTLMMISVLMIIPLIGRRVKNV